MNHVSGLGADRAAMIRTRLSITRPLQLSEEQWLDMASRIDDEIIRSKGERRLAVTRVYDPLGRIEMFQFAASEVFKFHKTKLLTVLTTGRIGRFQRWLRRKRSRITGSDDYWATHPSLAWDVLYKTNPITTAYDNTRSVFVRHDYLTYQEDLLTRLAARIRDADPTSVLELGCGCGRVTAALAKRDVRLPHWVGLDYSPTAVIATLLNLQAENLLTNHRVVCGDFRATGLDPKSIDVTYSVWSLPYGCMESPSAIEDIINELLRVTRKKLILIEPDLPQSRWTVNAADGFFNLGEFCTMLEERGCIVSRSLLPIQINWLIPVYIVEANVSEARTVGAAAD